MQLALLALLSICSSTAMVIDSDEVFLPKFDRSEETVSVVVGKRALLPCYVSLKDVKSDALDTFKIIWMKLNSSSVLTMEERAVNGDPRISLLHPYADEWNLQIDDVDEDDAGVYRCFNNHGKYKTLILDVKVPPKIDDQRTTLPYPPAIRAGYNFTIKCHAHGKPTPSVRILAYDQSEIPKIISEQNEVTIVNISRRAQHRYECIAGNGYPPDVARSFQLNVQYPPELNLAADGETLSTSLLVRSKPTEIRLRCQVSMSPPGKVHWLKDDQPINWNYQIYHLEHYTIAELIIEYFTSDHQGQYACVASNALGTSSRSVQIVSLPTPVTTTTATLIGRVTSRQKRPKHVRTTKAIDLYSAESLRIMTLSSRSSTMPVGNLAFYCFLSVVIVSFR